MPEPTPLRILPSTSDATVREALRAADDESDPLLTEAVLSAALSYVRDRTAPLARPSLKEGIAGIDLDSWSRELESPSLRLRFFASVLLRCQEEERKAFEMEPGSDEAAAITEYARPAGDAAAERISFMLTAPLHELTARLRARSEPITRTLLDEVSDHFSAYLDTHQISMWSASSDRKTRVTPQIALGYASMSECDIEVPGLKDVAIGDGNAISDLANLIRTERYRLDLEERFPRVDRTVLSKYRDEFGAKAAALMVLRDDWEKLLEQCDEFHSFEIPEFVAVPLSVYDAFARGEPIDTHLRAFHEWIAGREVMVRSSAERSEDTPESTGAGIYQSIALQGGASYEEFEKAVRDVYATVTTADAVRYRESVGIEGRERMGIVLQVRVEPVGSSLGDGLSFCNTVRRSAPEVAEVADDFGTRVLYKRDLLFSDAAEALPRECSPLVFPVDAQHVREVKTRSQATLALHLELYFGSAQQVEFCGSAHFPRYLLQSRPLPMGWGDRSEVRFPERDDALFAGQGIGVIDAKLPILGLDRSNGTKAGILVVESSHMASEFPFDRYLPKEGAVWILHPSRELGGHVETRAVQKGLTLIVGSPDDLTREIAKDGPAYSSLGFRIARTVNGCTALHVVADGLTARIYPGTPA